MTEARLPWHVAGPLLGLVIVGWVGLRGLTAALERRP